LAPFLATGGPWVMRVPSLSIPVKIRHLQSSRWPPSLHVPLCYHALLSCATTFLCAGRGATPQRCHGAGTVQHGKARTDIFHGATPSNFRRWLRGTDAYQGRQGGEKVIFINAWNNRRKEPILSRIASSVVVGWRRSPQQLILNRQRVN
jgi:hypothetical protein